MTTATGLKLIRLGYRMIGVIYFLQVFPKPWGVYQNNVDEKKGGQGEEKNDKVNQQDADANQYPVGHTHNRLHRP